VLRFIKLEVLPSAYQVEQFIGRDSLPNKNPLSTGEGA
jgi:hypothetical protein